MNSWWFPIKQADVIAMNLFIATVLVPNKMLWWDSSSIVINHWSPDHCRYGHWWPSALAAQCQTQQPNEPKSLWQHTQFTSFIGHDPCAWIFGHLTRTPLNSRRGYQPTIACCSPQWHPSSTPTGCKLTCWKTLVPACRGDHGIHYHHPSSS